METNSLVVTDSNVQALANALCMFAEKMGELSRLYPVYPNSAMESLQRLTDKMQALELQMQKRANFWRRPWNVLPKSLQKFGKMRMWTHCWYRLQQQCKAFRTFYKRSMKRMTLFPLAPQQRFSKMFSRFLLMTLYLPLNKKSNRPKSQGIRSYGTTCSKSFRLCFAL